jgi:copper chaperone
MSSSQTVFVENIRCGGCMKSIKDSLMKLPGVSGVEVNKEEERVWVTGNDIVRESIIGKLATLGYPEKGNNSLLRKARSLVSCATGKMS